MVAVVVAAVEEEECEKFSNVSALLVFLYKITKTDFSRMCA